MARNKWNFRNQYVIWGMPESYRYCFDGIDKNSVVAIGTVGGSPRKYIDRNRFEKGLAELVRVLHPHTIIIYGSANYPNTSNSNMVIGFTLLQCLR